ncbi:MAG: hypothetical protein WD801_11730 [Gemmatimonadaceae bacterium]
MSSRPVSIRVLALLWAALQLASPGLSALADGQLSAQELSPRAHVEATSSATCPVVHSPDCGMCRYLSQGAHIRAVAPLVAHAADACTGLLVERNIACNPATALPRDRAPPLV